MKRFLTSVALFAFATLPGVASAGSATAASSVSLVVQGNCTITNASGAGNLNFGTISALASGPQLAAGTLQYACTTGTVPIIAFNDASSTGTANFTLRASATSAILYQLCLQTAFSNGTCSSPILNSTTSTFAPPAQPSIPIQAFFTLGSSVGAGTYSDTVTATLTF